MQTIHIEMTIYFKVRYRMFASELFTLKRSLDFNFIVTKFGWHSTCTSTPSNTWSLPKYSFLRMPFGISSASEILQKRNQQLFGHIPNVHVEADDRIIATDT